MAAMNVNYRSCQRQWRASTCFAYSGSAVFAQEMVSMCEMLFFDTPVFAIKFGKLVSVSIDILAL